MKLINTFYSPRLTNFWRHFPWLIFTISLCITLWLWQILQSNITQANSEQFELRLERVKAAIINRLHAYEHVLRGGVAIFAMMPDLGREAWHLYVNQLQNQDYYPGILAIGFSQQITDAEKSQHIASVRAEGFSNYTIYPPTKNDYYMPLIYLEPLTETYKQSLGFDGYCEPRRRAAIEQARDSGQAAMTQKLVLAIEKTGESKAGVVLYLPVYRQGLPLKTIIQRRQAFLGVVSSGFRMKDLMQNILGDSQLDINFAIYDGPQVQAKNLLYQDSFAQEQNYQAQFEKFIQVELEGRIWTLHFSTLPQFDQHSRRHAPDFVLFGGLFVSFLLFGLAWSLTTTQQINSRLQSEIGERKSIEHRLRTQEELLRLVIDSIPQFIFWKDLKNIYLGCNRRFALMVGINEPTEVVGKMDEQLIWPLESTLAFRSLDQRIIQTDQPEYHRIETLPHDNGQQKWFDTSRIPLHDSEGEVMGILVTFEDITEQKLAELELQRSRAAELQANIELNQFKTTLDLTLDGVFIREATGFKFSYVNQGMTKLLGYSKAELLTMMPIDINPEMSSQRLSELLEFLREGSQKATTFTANYCHKTGQLIPVEVSLQYIEVSGQSSRFIGIVRDITERKQTEAQLQQAFADIEQAKMAAEMANVELSQFKTTLDMTLDVVLMRDAKTLKFIYANQGAAKKLGYTPEELLLMTPLDLNPEITMERLQQLVDSQTAITFETVVRHKNGTLIPIELFIQYIELPGQISHFISIGRDITERKQTEKALLATKEAAEQAQVEAEVANRAKSTFLANMSHELRTPLNGILGYAQILSRDKTLSEKQREGIEIIQRSGDYLLTLINDILDLSKIEAEKIEIYPTDFHFGDFIQGIAELFQMRAKQKGIAFNYKPLSHLPIGVRADEKRLRQILINLIGNAIKFTERGGVNLKVGYHEHQIRFQVEDTGIGIPTSELEKIFLPFQQVGDQNSRAEGTGLGLSITKKLVEMMGGQLLVESTVGKGSIFWFALALPDVSHLIKKEHESIPVIIGFEGPHYKLLVVDDSWENRSVLNNLLTPLGFEIVEAVNGLDALNNISQIKPDLIITDLVMSEMDGFEMTRQVKKMPAFEKLPVIAASASVFEIDKQQSIQAGCNDFVAKPIRADLLLEKLRIHLNLTWIYENLDEQEKDNQPNETDPDALTSDDEQIGKGPSAEQANILFDLAMMGDIGGILEAVDNLEKTDKQLHDFCHHIRMLAKNFDEEQICQLIEQYI